MPTFRFKHDTTGKGTKPIARRIDDAGDASIEKEAKSPAPRSASPNADLPEVTSDGSQLSDYATPNSELVSSEPSPDETPAIVPDSVNDLTTSEDGSATETSLKLAADTSPSESDANMIDTQVAENDPALASVVTEEANENATGETMTDEVLPPGSESQMDVSSISSATDESNSGTDPKAELLSELREELLNELRVELKDELRAELKEELKAELKAKLKADLRNSLKNNLNADEHSA